MTRHLPFAAIVVLALATLCAAQPQPTASPSPAAKPRAPRMSKAQLQKKLSEMETALWEAFKNKDPKPFAAHLRADAIVVGEEGASGKSVMPQAVTGCDVKSFKLSDRSMIRPNLTSAMLTYKGTQEGTCGGTAMPATVWASSLWVQRGATWVAVFHQESTAK